MYKTRIPLEREKMISPAYFLERRFSNAVISKDGVSKERHTIMLLNVFHFETEEIDLPFCLLLQ